MFKSLTQKKAELLEKKSNKKEKTLDYYISEISKNPAKSQEYSWWNRSEKRDGESDKQSQEYEFLKKNVKATKAIPPGTEKVPGIPNNIGYFETKFGTISVGNKKYKKNSKIGFSLVPNSEKEQLGIPEKDLKSKKTYFGEQSKSRLKRFKASEISFVYDPKTKDVVKLEDDNDGILDEEGKLLYQDKRENLKLKYLREARNEKTADKNSIDNQIRKVKEIKDEKEEDNLEFLKQITDFTRKMKQNKIQKTIESDDAMVRRRRILELSGSENLDLLDDEELREYLKELMEVKKPGAALKEKIQKMSKKELISAILKLENNKK